MVCYYLHLMTRKGFLALADLLMLFPSASGVDQDGPARRHQANDHQVLGHIEPDSTARHLQNLVAEDRRRVLSSGEYNRGRPPSEVNV